jgi:GcrA cell cycle regulator
MTLIETPGKNLRDTWSAERIAQLKSGFNAGLSCAQIANEIGVSRNAVIGKMNRLGLSRGRTPRTPRARASGPSTRQPQILTQRFLLKALFASAPVADDVVSAEPCSLLNLAPRKCRWPISGAGTGFTFCGNTTVDGVSYCAGHARMAYRGSDRIRAASRAAS